MITQQRKKNSMPILDMVSHFPLFMDLTQQMLPPELEIQVRYHVDRAQYILLGRR